MHFSRFTAAFLSYVLVMLLCLPFVVTAEPERQPSSPSSALQTPGRRAGELLVKFRDGASQQARELTLVTHGARRKKNLRGESGMEKLEVLSSQEPQTVALQLMLERRTLAADCWSMVLTITK